MKLLCLKHEYVGFGAHGYQLFARDSNLAIGLFIKVSTDIFVWDKNLIF